MRTGRLLGSGRTADVYELHPAEGEPETPGPVPLVDLADTDGSANPEAPAAAWVLRRYRDGWGDAVAEAEVMEYVWGHGYPVPRVRSATRTDMVLERLSGPTMLEAFAAGLLDPARAGGTLARLLHDLHALPPRPVRSDPPRSQATRVLHLDLHPENVILTPHGPQVIDWSNAEEGPALTGVSPR